MLPAFRREEYWPATTARCINATATTAFLVEVAFSMASAAKAWPARRGGRVVKKHRGTL